MFAHRSSGKIGTAGVKPSPQPQQSQPQQERQERQRLEQEIEETVFRPPKEKRKKLKFQRE